ncbi:MAG: hypothetical protein PHP44_03050 [Kiritimatiellae bacterium]|nr:hypothetical protein [Kiritimatiellia bacterium]
MKSEQAKQWLSGLVLWGFGLMLCGCGTTRPVGDERYLTLMERGGRAYAGGRDDTAASEYEAAFQRALGIGDARSAGDAAYNQALIQARKADYEKALQTLSSGMACVRSDGGTVGWDMELLEAKILSALGRDSEALQALDRAALAPGSDAAGVREQLDLCRAQLEWKLGGAEESERILNELMKKNVEGNTRLSAGCYRLRGDLGAAKGMNRDAAADYAKAVALYKTANDYGDMVDTMSQVATAYGQAGAWNEAGDYALRAALVFYGQHRYVDALKAIEQSLQMAQKSGDAELESSAETLFGLIKQKVSGTKEEQ